MKKHEYKRTDITNNTFLRVPNTAKGQRFLADLKHYSAAGVRMRIRGRGSRKQAREITSSSRAGMLSRFSLNQELPPHLATSLAVYLTKPALRDKQRDQWHNSTRVWLKVEQERHAAELAQLAEYTHRVEAQLAQTRRERDVLAAEVAQRQQRQQVTVVQVFISQGAA